MRIALHTKVRADRVEEYEAAHREVPEELTDAIRAAGVSEWTIWRSGTDLFHVLEVPDYGAMIAELEKLPVNTAWQARMGELLAVTHDYSADGADASLPVVWQLPTPPLVPQADCTPARPFTGATVMSSAAPSSPRITALDVLDVRFPTSEHLDGSDAMNPEPDYSAAYVVLRTDAGDGLEGHALAFTTGRGNDAQAAAISTLAPHVVGLSVEDVCGDLGAFSRSLVHDPQLRWLGPEKGAIHMATGAVVNAAWDLAAKRAGKPVWRFLAEMSPEELVAQVDFRWLSDALTPDEALEILERAQPGREERIARLLERGYPAYTTTPGWLGYSDEKLTRLAREAVADGFTQIKLKVGASLEDDVRRLRTARAAVGPDIRVAVDANQRWDVQPAIDWMTALAPYDPYWIEEPTSPDDILGHAAVRRAAAPIKVATGEHVANRVVFKQLLQAGAVDIVQIDSARVGGVNENIAILLLAAKFGVPVCPHAGGVGLCEMVQHLSMFDYVSVSGTTEDRVIEYVDHLHEHFVDPVRIADGHYLAPTLPGLSAQMHPDSLKEYTYPDGPVWLARV